MRDCGVHGTGEQDINSTAMQAVHVQPAAHLCPAEAQRHELQTPPAPASCHSRQTPGPGRAAVQPAAGRPTAATAPPLLRPRMPGPAAEGGAGGM